ncbi:MAG: YfcE family phosphodiesterase [Pirellulaceae bacterium]|nr:YfcE family phosphodiesterase [Pirellulaceae bacterium]
MRIGVLSDTHDNVDATKKAVNAFAEIGVSLVIHCGDITTPEIVSLFTEWPTHFVFGNMDTNQAALKEAIEEEGHQCHGYFGEIEIAGVSVAFLHSHDQKWFNQVKSSGEYNLVFYGHTHQAEEHKEGETIVINPGALYRADYFSCVIYDLAQMKATLLEIEK